MQTSFSLLIALCALFCFSYSLRAPANQGSQITNNTYSNESNVRCVLCGIFVNEIEGMISENLTEAEIIKLANSGICGIVGGSFGTDCKQLMALIPKLINYYDNKDAPSKVCVEERFCEVPFWSFSDPAPVLTYEINLDLTPEDRWKTVCANPLFKETMTRVIMTFVDLFKDVKDEMTVLGRLLSDVYYPSEYSREIKGCATMVDLDYGWLTVLNLVYELTDACTSIVAQTPQNTILHVRNMDFWDGIWLSDNMKNLTFTARYTKQGKTQFYATTFAGYVGVLSGMKPNAFSISINTRNAHTNIFTFLKTLVKRIVDHASFTSFLTRETLATTPDWPSALSELSKRPIDDYVYYTLGGVSAGQGAVITRNPVNATDIWILNATSGRWFEVQTNYDHWGPMPWFDDRLKPANTAITAIGRPNISLEDLFHKVLQLKPVLNLQTVFTMLTSAATGNYTSFIRSCAYPCAE